MAVFQNMPAELSGLATLPLQEVFAEIAKLESDPFKIYDIIEAVYRQNFLEKPIIKKYGHLFDDNAEGKFKKRFEEIRNTVT